MSSIYKAIEKSVKYALYLRSGNQPRNNRELLKHFEVLLDSIAVLSKNRKHGNIPLALGIQGPGGIVEVELLDNCSVLLKHLYPLIFESIVDSVSLFKYLKTTSNFLSSEDVSLISKIYVMESENNYLEKALESAFSASFHGFNALKARLNFISLLLSSADDSINPDKKATSDVFLKYLSKAIEFFLFKGQFLQADDFLNQLLKNATSIVEKCALITVIVKHSAWYNLKSRSQLNTMLDEYGDILSPEELDNLRGTVNFDLEADILRFFSASNGTLSEKSVRNRKIITTLSFSIPSPFLSRFPLTMNIDNKSKITLYPVSAFWEDPIFKVMSCWNIMNVGWSYYCDIEPKDGKNYTHVILWIDDLYIPDIDLNETGYSDIDFSEKEALIGRPYYPHKEFAVTTLLSVFSELQNHIGCKRNEIGINMFSNYLVKHIDRTTNEIIHQKVYALTNPDSYSKTRTRFIERLNSVNLADSYIDVRSLLLKTKIETEKSLKEFVFRCVDIFVKHNIENQSGYKYLWKNDQNGNQTPKREPESQPYICSHLRAVFDFMGIQISREVVSSNGSVDFLISFTTIKHLLLKLCVELKLAHSDDIERGLTNQLPAYMRGERCKYGIYLVLWYKGDNFSKPNAYEHKDELKTRLDYINSSRNVSNLIIDCTKPIPPSKLK